MLLLALILTMVAGIILGMGLPTTPAYIVQVALLVPALVRLGVQVEAAHMFVLYFAVLSAITPPVAMAVYAACGISRSGLMERLVGRGEARADRLHHPVHVRLRPVAAADGALVDHRDDRDHRNHRRDLPRGGAAQLLLLRPIREPKRRKGDPPIEEPKVAPVQERAPGE
jgi:hypothetical protein